MNNLPCKPMSVQEREAIRNRNRLLTIALVAVITALVVYVYLNQNKKRQIKTLKEQLEKETSEKKKIQIAHKMQGVISSEEPSKFPAGISERISKLNSMCDDAPDLVNELNEIMPLIVEEHFSKAFSGMSKIVENLLKESFNKSQNKPKSILEFIEKSDLFSEAEKECLKEIKAMRNEEAHELGVNKKIPPDKFITHILFSLEISIKLKKNLQQYELLPQEQNVLTPVTG